MKEIISNIKSLMEKDSVRYYFLCKKCISNSEVSGWGTITGDEELVIV